APTATRCPYTTLFRSPHGRAWAVAVRKSWLPLPRSSGAAWPTLFYLLVVLPARRPVAAARPVRAPARRLRALPARRGMPCAAGVVLRVLGRSGRPAWFRATRAGLAGSAAALRAVAGRGFLARLLPSAAIFLGVYGSDGLRRAGVLSA